MGEIKLLSKSVSDKIAAGEVVERPASVIKELVENAIDAGASAVSVSITGGGIKSITVADNGSGIFPDDVALAFTKHATSKISEIKDLEFIGTQGFRGEALSSIAAVSVLEMKTKRREEETGTYVKLTGGRIDNENPAGLSDGTTVSVSNLFFNVPARLKFLKKEASEAAYVSDLVSRFILAYPEISFHYSSDSKTIYHSPGNGDLKAALYCIYGASIMDIIEHIEYEHGGIKVFGYASRPGTVTKRTRQGSFFVNRRYVRNTALFEMIRAAYGETLVKGESPFFVINIELPLSAVDVNVHPNKLQVRFRDSAAIEHVIKEAVSQICMVVRGSIAERVAIQNEKVSVELKRPAEGVQEEFFSGFAKTVLRETESTFCAETQHDYEYAEPEIKNVESYDFDNKEAEYPRPETEQKTVITEAYKIIGSLDFTYALVEQEGDLLIIDQHAAHERLLYNKYRINQSDASQALLESYVVTVSHEQKNLIAENFEILKSAGFDIEPFGVMEYKINAVPAIAFGVSAEALLFDALEEIPSGKDFVLKREAVIMSACRSAVKAGDPLNRMELKSIIDEFLQGGAIPTCPHGRPVISVITKKQIEKSFKRTI